MRPAPPIGIESCACSSIPALTLRWATLPTPAPIAAPTAVAARSGGANSPTTKPGPAERERPLPDGVVLLVDRDVALQVLAHDDEPDELGLAGVD